MLNLLQHDRFECRELSIEELSDYVVDVRRRVGAACSKLNPKIYWKMCAINEISELAMHYSWEVWKPSEEIDYVSAQQEAIDVVVFTIAALTSNYTRIELHPFEHKKFIHFWGENKMYFHVNCGELTHLPEAPEERFPECGYRLIQYIQSPDLDTYGLGGARFIDIITILCQLTKMDEPTFIATLVAKITLVSCRLDNGTYHSDWNKVTQDGRTEVSVLHHIIKHWVDTPEQTINQLISTVVETASIFRY